MKDSELDHINDINDLTDEVLAELSAKQAIMLRERFRIDTNKIENSARSLPV